MEWGAAHQIVAYTVSCIQTEPHWHSQATARIACPTLPLLGNGELLQDSHSFFVLDAIAVVLSLSVS